MNIIVVSCPGSRLIARLLGAFLLLAQMTATLEAHDEPDATTPITSGRHTQFQASYAEIVRDTLPAVVNIFSQRHQQQRRVPFQFGNEDLFRFFFPQQQRPRYLLGSGVIVAPHNLLVSNHHVIEGADEIFAVLDDGRHYQVELILSDPKTDLAILRFLDETALNGRNGLDLATDDRLQIGDLVLAIGNPFGVGQTVTSGIVSALDRSAPGISKLASFIQTDASINPGNSGGPLIDMQGQLVAINTAIFSNSGGSVGLGLSVPASMVARVVFDAHHHGELRRPWLGIESHDMSWE
ncbi:MAG: trypsin-like peptidase domain-containing protein, partial [Pseudomonadota bacterium]